MSVEAGRLKAFNRIDEGRQPGQMWAFFTSVSTMQLHKLRQNPLKAGLLRLNQSSKMEWVLGRVGMEWAWTNEKGRAMVVKPVHAVIYARF